MILPQNYSIDTTKTSFKCFTFIYITIINTNKTQPAPIYYTLKVDVTSGRKEEKRNAMARYDVIVQCTKHRRRTSNHHF